MEQLTAVDGAFIHGESHNLPMHFASVAIYDQSTAPGGVVRFKDILDVFKEVIREVPMFRRRLVEVPLSLDQPYWIEDPNFDIEFHVRHIALPLPGDWRQLYIQLARLHSRPLDRGHPMWEAYVIEGLNKLEGIPEGSFAVLTKIHHAAMDGVSAGHLFSSMHDFSPEPRKRDKKNTPLIAESRPGPVDLLVRSYRSSRARRQSTGDVARKAATAFNRVRKMKQSGELKAAEETPDTRFNRDVSSHRVITSVEVDFKEVNRARKVVKGVTVNDFVLAVFGGALRRYLLDKGELPDTSLISQTPVNLRPKGREEDAGNQITTMNVPLRTDIENPLQRLKGVHKEAVAAKAYAQALGQDLMAEVSSVLSPLVAKSFLSLQANSDKFKALSSMLPVAPNTIISNVAGSPVPYYLCGAEAVGGLGMGPVMPGTGLFQCVFTQNNKMTMSVVCCRDIMPDPEFYQQCIRQSYREMVDACLKSQKSPAAKAGLKPKAGTKTTAKPKTKTKTKSRVSKSKVKTTTGAKLTAKPKTKAKAKSKN